MGDRGLGVSVTEQGLMCSPLIFMCAQCGVDYRERRFFEMGSESEIHPPLS